MPAVNNSRRVARRWRERGQVVLLGGAILAAAVAITFAGCASVKRDTGEADAATPGAGTGGRTTRPDGGVRPDGPTPLDSNCVRTSCTPPGGRYCDIVGDNCGQSINCGACPGDQMCDKGLCVGGPSCVPRASCGAPGGGNYCGDIGDGCGHSVACGDCTGGSVCRGGLCVAANCVALTCNIPGGGKYCGTVGDGCGGTLNCTCEAPQTCGGTGVEHVCGDPACVPIQCMPMGGGQYCGDIGNGCGKALSCPAGCPNGVACPATHVCPGSTGTCIGLQCQIDKCTGSATKTTISGTVYDPLGVNPLYNVVVYVPKDPSMSSTVSHGSSCDSCIALVPVLSVALSDVVGHFVLEDVFAGTNVPIVMQAGK